MLFPLRIGASTVLLEQPTPDNLLAAIAKHGATVCFTAPTAYRAMIPKLAEHDIKSLRKCVSAGEVAAEGDVRGLAQGDRHQNPRRHRRDRDAAHLHRLARGGGARRLHRPRGAGLRGDRDRRRGQRNAAGHRGTFGGSRAHGLPLSRRQPAVQLRAERLERHRRHLRDGSRPLLLVPGALRRHDHLVGLQHRRARGGIRAAHATPRSPNAAWSARPTRSAARSSRPTWCCAPARQATRR